MNKKILHLIAAFLMGLSGVMAQTVQLETVTNAMPGPVTVDIDMSGFPTAVAAITLYIAYDSDLLEYSGNSSFSYGGGNMLVGTTANQLEMSWFNTSGTNVNIQPITLPFNYLGGLSSDLTISFVEIVDVELNEVTVLQGNGSVNPATPDGAVALGNKLANVGSSVGVEITSTADPGELANVTAITLKVEYDQDRLNYENTNVNVAGMLVNEDNGIVSITWNNSSGIDLASLHLATLNFEYLGGGAAAVDFKPGSQILSGKDVAESVVFLHGSVQVDPDGPFVATLSIADVINPLDATNVPVAISISDYLAGVGIIDLTMQFDPSKVSYLGYTANQQSQWLVFQSDGVVRFQKTNSGGMNIDAGAVLTPRFAYNTLEVADIVFGPSLFADTDGDAIAVLFADGFIKSANSLTVSTGLNGQLGANYDGTYDFGTEIEIVAIADPGYVFDAWTGDVAFLDDASLATATVTMPDEDVDLTANFVVDATVFFDLTTAAGPFGSATGGGSFNVEHQQVITATPDPGYYFVAWTGDVQYITTGDVTDASVTVTMPGQNITLTATFEGYTISGIVKYANTSGPVRPINTNATSTTEVIRYAIDGTTELDRVYADINGAYLFENVPAGDYVVTAVTNKPWGGFNSFDDIRFRSHINGSNPLTGLFLIAADVDNNGLVNAFDGVRIRTRITQGSTIGWNRPEWNFQSVAVTVSSNISTDILGICTGDVNGSYRPPLL